MNATGIILLIIMILFAVYYFVYENDKFRQIPFDSQRWLKSDAYHRGWMMDDLIESKILLNRTEDQIVRILGQPDEIHQRKEYNEYQWEYDLGIVDSNSIFMPPYDYWLIIIFDERGQVNRTLVYRRGF